MEREHADAIKFPKTPRLVAVMRQDVHRAWKRHLAVVEEKVDGANTGIWLDATGTRLQSRGHVLRGGARERQFAPLHAWAAERGDELGRALGTRYVLYGEWCFAKHRAFYDALPDLFLAFDVLDRQTGNFLPTPARDAIFAAARVRAVPRLWTGRFGKAPAFGSLIGPSRLKTPRWRETLSRSLARAGVTSALDDTDDSDGMEGIYVRVEDDAGVVARMKLHRDGVEKPHGDAWRRRPLVPNVLLASQPCPAR